MRNYLKTYVAVVVTIVLIVGLSNCLVDPLWYLKGNVITGVNPPWNERLSKTNLFLNSVKEQNYDCLILGTSRLTFLHGESLKQNHCFNYAFSKGRPEEYLEYAKFSQEQGLDPKVIYVGIEPHDFSRSVQPVDPIASKPLYRSYFFSIGNFLFSLAQVFGKYQFPLYYDQNFDVYVSKTAPDYNPNLRPQQESNNDTCDNSRVEIYKSLRALFPDTQLIGFIPPVSAWYLYNTRYSVGLLYCQLEYVHQVANFFDMMYDFSVPSALTLRTDNTYDGRHYEPEVFDIIAAVLEHRQPLKNEFMSFGIDVKPYSTVKYKQIYASRLALFLAKIGREELL